MILDPADRRADEEARALRAGLMQRRRLAVGTVAFVALAGSPFPASDGALRLVIVALVGAVTLGLYFIRATHARFPLLILPLTVAAAHSGAVAAVALIDPEPDVLRFAIMYACLGSFLCLLAPARRTALAAISTMSLIAAVGALALAVRTPSFNLALALALLVVILAVSTSIAGALDDAWREAVALRAELARRATSDGITGVSNRAHVTLIAQNEFARARRYGESYSCLMIEIEDYDQLLATHGRAALAALVQVFTGYCVVVMRHCDSFGRLSPSRFLALLPETPTLGAQTLANRMCRELAELGVAHAGGRLNFTVSIGATEMHAVDRWAGDLLRRAEQGLTDALERGGNCAVFATPPVNPFPGSAPDEGAQGQGTADGANG